jgi:hypothetical protein
VGLTGTLPGTIDVPPGEASDSTSVYDLASASLTSASTTCPIISIKTENLPTGVTQTGCVYPTLTDDCYKVTYVSGEEKTYDFDFIIVTEGGKENKVPIKIVIACDSTT